MKRVFLDTVGLIAIWDSTDQWNAVAEMAMLELMKSSIATITTDQILMECGNASSRRPYRCEVNALRKKLKEGGKLFQPTEAEMEQAWEAYDRQEAAGAGIVDQVSFIMMRRLGITEAFTNDEHFRAAGFVTLF
jgi:predicted nucleic acid-binding protein